MFSACPKFLHWIWRLVALELRVLAPMTMPGMRTKCETLVAVRPRMDVCDTEEWTRSWCSGSARARSRSSSLREGYRIFCVQVLSAASNFRSVSVVVLYYPPPFCSGSYNGYNVGRLIVQSMRQMLVECDEVSDVDVAVVLLR